MRNAGADEQLRRMTREKCVETFEKRLVPATLVGCRRIKPRCGQRHPGKETHMTKKFMAIPLVAVALSMSGGAVRAAEPTTSELMQQINQLQAKVQQLETKQEAIASKDVDATVDQVLQDADKRSQLLQMEGFTAGWQQGKGFRIQDAQGNFVLHPFFQAQLR